MERNRQNPLDTAVPSHMYISEYAYPFITTVTGLCDVLGSHTTSEGVDRASGPSVGSGQCGASLRLHTEDSRGKSYSRDR